MQQTQQQHQWIHIELINLQLLFYFLTFFVVFHNFYTFFFHHFILHNRIINSFFVFFFFFFLFLLCDFSVNKINTLQPFEDCLKLQELYLRKNNIQDINEIAYLQNLPNLKYLWLEENPCCDRAGTK